MSYLDKLLLGYKQVIANNNIASPLPARAVLNFVGFSQILDDPTLGSTDIYPQSGTSVAAGLQVIEGNGSALPFETTLDFQGLPVAHDATNHRNIVSAGYGSPGSTITGSYSVQLADLWKKFDATAGTVAFTLPGPIAETAFTVGITREFTHIAGNGSGGVVATFNGNGANVSFLDGTFGTNPTVSLTTPGITVRLRWDGTVYRCVN